MTLSVLQGLPLPLIPKAARKEASPSVKATAPDSSETGVLPQGRGELPEPLRA